MPARSSGLLCAVFMWPPVDSKRSPGVALCVPVEPSVCDHCAIRLNDEAALEDRREFVAACSVLRECWMGCGSSDSHGTPLPSASEISQASMASLKVSSSIGINQ